MILKKKKRTSSKDEINALERDYKDIKKEQKDLKGKLKSNNRKFIFSKNIKKDIMILSKEINLFCFLFLNNININFNIKNK